MPDSAETAVKQWRFPLDDGYATVSRTAAEEQAIGTITLDGMVFYLGISTGPIPGQRR